MMHLVLVLVPMLCCNVAGVFQYAAACVVLLPVFRLCVLPCSVTSEYSCDAVSVSCTDGVLQCG